jgi:hypothetical protein
MTNSERQDLAACLRERAERLRPCWKKKKFEESKGLQDEEKT